MIQSPDGSIARFLCLHQQKFTLEPIQLRLVVPLPSLTGQCQRFSPSGYLLFGSPPCPIHLSQEGKKLRPPCCRSCGLPGGSALAYLGDRPFALSLLG